MDVRAAVIKQFRDEADAAVQFEVRWPKARKEIHDDHAEWARLLNAAADWLERNGDQEPTP